MSSPTPKVRARRPDAMTPKVARYTLATQYPGMPGYADVRPVTAHVQELNRLGLPYRSIAREAGMNEDSVAQIARGQRPACYTRQAVALMRVDHRPKPIQGRVIAVGAVRRLRALAVLGWPWKPLSEHTTLKRQLLTSLALVPPYTTSYEIWSAVHELYEPLSGTPGPCMDTRARAIERGWWATLDWEGLDIDDPRVEPDADVLEPESLTKGQISDERAAEVQRLTAAGLSAAEIAARMGLSGRQVVRLRSRKLAS